MEHLLCGKYLIILHHMEISAQFGRCTSFFYKKPSAIKVVQAQGNIKIRKITFNFA